MNRFFFAFLAPWRENAIFTGQFYFFNSCSTIRCRSKCLSHPKTAVCLSNRPAS